MRLESEEIRQAIAAEYVLGTLPGRVERWVNKRLDSRPALARAVHEWQERLHGLTYSLKPVVVPEIVWQTLGQRIGMNKPDAHSAARSARDGALASAVLFWRRFAVAATTLAAGLLVVLMWPDDEAAPVPAETRVVIEQTGPVDEADPGVDAAMISLQPYDRLTLLAADDQRVGWLVRADVQGARVHVRAVNVAPVAAAQDLELWVLPSSGSPVSVGLLPLAGEQVFDLNVDTVTRIETAPAMAVSLEPKGGSPTGAPTGPVIYQGQLVTVPPAG